MITKLYSFYDTPFDHDVCHLFEHIVLRGFLLELNAHGYNRAFFGWLRGNTIDSTIFFDLGAYSADVAALFDNYLKTLGSFDQKTIVQSLAHIEAEMSCVITVVDKALLLRQLDQLTHIVRCETIDPKTSLVKSPLRIIHKPGRFEEIAVLINVFSNSEKIQKAFLGLHPAILDIIRDAAIDTEAAYPIGKSAIAINDDGMGIAWRFNIKKNVNIKVLEDATNQYLKAFDIVEYIKHINLYQNAISTDSSYSTNLIQFYEQTGIRGTREELAQLATDEHMVEIIKNMTVRFAPVEGKLKKIEWNY